MTAPILSRVFHCRDDRGALRELRVESTDPGELDRVERIYRAMERRATAGERRFRNGHATFTDLGVEPGAVAESGDLPASKRGYPWEGPRFAFALLLGESATWDGPGEWFEHAEAVPDPTPENPKNRRLERSLYGNEAASPGSCRVCAGLGELPVYACCLHCCRTGRDLAIGRGAARTEGKRHRPGKLKGGKS